MPTCRNKGVSMNEVRTDATPCVSPSVCRTNQGAGGYKLLSKFHDIPAIHTWDADFRLQLHSQL